ncbi:MAG: Tex family protein [Paludibacteraceae bacterium]
MLSEQLITLLVNANQLSPRQIRNTLTLIDEGATIPFISRYRKEATGNMDEVQIAELKGLHEKLVELAKRKEAVIKSIDEQEKLTDELRERIEACWNATELEDIYLPYKPKKRTRAEIAREKGLEPLAKILMAQKSDNVVQSAKSFVNEQVTDEEDALKGARDIIAEWVNESEAARNAVRSIFASEAIISSKVVKGKEEDAQKFRDYFDAGEKLTKISSHRFLAMHRGEAEGFLRLNIAPVEEEKCLDRLLRIFKHADNKSGMQVEEAVVDAYKRLLKPSIENEFSNSGKEKADAEAIRVFAENLKQLLLAPPLGQKRVMGIDPGFRTGCKVVCLDAQGNLLHNENIYPHPPMNEYSQAQRKIQKMVESYDIQSIAIGNGTAGRETEQFIQNIRYDRKVQVFVVSENGASIYSASKIAREEFPDYDVTVRGAVSIGRRLMDPLAELVKIDPKSIGVGQYQHDVDQPKLKTALDQTVENAVNRVGVNLNTASKHLLTYVSGVGAQIAQNIVDYRAEYGAFLNRKSLLKVPKLGSKTFEQCAGFLRVAGGDNPLDNSAVHPESYAIVNNIAKDLHLNINELIGNKEIRKSVDLNLYVTHKVGMPTLNDIMDELEKPGRDPRSAIQVFEFDPNVKKIDDLREGMELPGIITNVTNFGAFCDIGIKENGLIHISNLADRYVSNPADIVSLHQHVKVRVLEVDMARKRIQLKLL